MVQKKSKGNNLLDYPLNIIDNLHVGINNKLSSLKSNNLSKFRWYREIYFAILGLKNFSLELSPLGLKVNLGDIGTISKVDGVIFFRHELTRDKFIRLRKRKRINDLYKLKILAINLDLKQINYIKENIKDSKESLIRKLKRDSNFDGIVFSSGKLSQTKDMSIGRFKWFFA